MLYRVAYAQKCSVDQLRARMSERELFHWIAFLELEPRGEEAAWLRHARSIAHLFNFFSGKDAKPVSPNEFLPDFE